MYVSTFQHGCLLSTTLFRVRPEYLFTETINNSTDAIKIRSVNTASVRYSFNNPSDKEVELQNIITNRVNVALLSNPSHGNNQSSEQSLVYLSEGT